MIDGFLLNLPSHVVMDCGLVSRRATNRRPHLRPFSDLRPLQYKLDLMLVGVPCER